MAGFLAMETDLAARKSTIEALVKLWKTSAYTVIVPCKIETWREADQKLCEVKILWRRSGVNMSWDARTFDSVDYSTMVLGLANAHGLAASFWQEHAF